MTEDLQFAADQGTKYGTDCGLMFLKAFATPQSAAYCDGWFGTLSNSIERDKQSILDRGGSEQYVQAFVTALFAAMRPYVDGYIFGGTIAEAIFKESFSK